MNNKPYFKKEILLLGGGLMVIGIGIGLLTPNSLEDSPTVIYQYGLLHIISGIIGLIGALILFVALVVANIRKAKTLNKCHTCGAAVLSTKDNFCRVCGTPLLQ